MAEIFLPEGKSFSYYPDGHRRNCAVVKIEYESKECYIIEIGRTDNWLISTLLVWPLIYNINNIKFESIIKTIIDDLFANNGHWNSKALKNNRMIRFYKMKHRKSKSDLSIVHNIYIIIRNI